MNQAGFAIPTPLAALLRRLPEAPPARTVAFALNTALRMGLLQREAFAALAGRVLRIEASDAGIGVTLTLRADGFAAVHARPHVVVRACVADYLQLALRREDPDTLFFTRRLVIEGDTDLGLSVKNALDALDWDRLPGPVRVLLRVLQR